MTLPPKTEFTGCIKCGACCEVQEDPFDYPEKNDFAFDRASKLFLSNGPFKPCKFLGPDKLCTIYENRPDPCRIDMGPYNNEEMLRFCNVLHIQVRGRKIDESNNDEENSREERS